MLNILKVSNLFKIAEQAAKKTQAESSPSNAAGNAEPQPIKHDLNVLKVSHLHVARSVKTLEEIKSRYPEYFPKESEAPIERVMHDGSTHKFFADRSLLVLDEHGLVLKTRDVKNQVREFRINERTGQTEMCFLGQWTTLSAEQKILPDGTFVCESMNRRVHHKLDGTTMTVCLDKGAVMETNQTSKTDIVLYSNGMVLIRRVDENGCEEQIVLKDSKETSRSKVYSRNNLLNVEIGPYVQRILASRMESELVDGKLLKRTFTATGAELAPLTLKFGQISVSGKFEKLNLEYANGEVIEANFSLRESVEYSFSGQSRTFYAKRGTLRVHKRSQGSFEVVLTNEETGENIQVGVVQQQESFSGFSFPRAPRIANTGQHTIIKSPC